MVKSCSGVEWFWFWMVFQTQQPNYSKSNQVPTNLDFHVLVLFSNGRDWGFSCSYVPDHSNTEPSQIWISKPWISNGLWIGMFGIQAPNIQV